MTRSFGESIYAGKINMNEAEMEKSIKKYSRFL